MAQSRSEQAEVTGGRAGNAGWLSWTRNGDYRTKRAAVIERGEGPYVFDAEGRRLLDGVSGLFTTQIGYSHGAELGAAAAAQLEQLGFYPNWDATHPAAMALTERVLELAPGMDHVFFTSGGSESVESAWKLARQHFLARGEPLRRKVIARRGAYHGSSLGATSLTGIPVSRMPFEPLLADARHVQSTDPRRCLACRDAGGCLLRCAEAVEQAIVAEGPGSVAMVIVEPVQNAGGCLVPAPGYGQMLREICDRHGVLLCCDEVITGFGRVGEWFGSQRFSFAPDLITCAKGISSGQAPLGAVLFSSRVAEPLEGETVYAHGYTFGGHPLSCAVALANLEIMERLDVVANVREHEAYLESTLAQIAAASPVCVDARGAGFFRALELRAPELVVLARDAIRRHGAIVRADARVVPCLAISPPLICDRSHIDELGQAVAAGLAEVQ